MLGKESYDSKDSRKRRSSEGDSAALKRTGTGGKLGEYFGSMPPIPKSQPNQTTHGSHAFGFLHPGKESECAPALIHNDVLLFYKEHVLTVQAILTDNVFPVSDLNSMWQHKMRKQEQEKPHGIIQGMYWAVLLFAQSVAGIIGERSEPRSDCPMLCQSCRAWKQNMLTLSKHLSLRD